jgi:hypothetical protein
VGNAIYPSVVSSGGVCDKRLILVLAAVLDIILCRCQTNTIFWCHLQIAVQACLETFLQLNETDAYLNVSLPLTKLNCKSPTVIFMIIYPLLS